MPEYRPPDERQPDYWPPGGREPEYWPSDGQPTQRRARARPPSPGPATGASRVIVIAVVAALVAAGLAFAAYRSLRGGGGTPRGSSTHHLAPPRTGGAAAVVLTPVGATGFDENSDSALAAIDNNPQTFWATSWYIGNPVFGGLKRGSGLMLDMGRTVRLSSVTVQFGPTPGLNVDIRIGNSNAQGSGSDAVGQATADAMTTVASESGVSGLVTFTINSNATGRYVLIWFTKLPPWTGHPDKYQEQIYNIVVKGSS